MVSGSLPSTFLLAPVLAGAALLTAFACLWHAGWQPAMTAAPVLDPAGYGDLAAWPSSIEHETLAVPRQRQLCAGGRRRASSDGRSRRWWSPAVSPRAGGTSPSRRARRARRWLHRGTDIAARARARARSRAVAVRRATAFCSSGRARRAALRASAIPPPAASRLICAAVNAPSFAGYSIAPCSDPTGKYGRCGSIINVAPAGTVIDPAPNGQMPAMARNSVDLPEPEGPVISVRSPLRKAELVDIDQRRAVRQLQRQFLEIDGAIALRCVDMNPVAAGCKFSCRTQCRPRIRRGGSRRPAIPPVDDRW